MLLLSLRGRTFYSIFSRHTTAKKSNAAIARCRRHGCLAAASERRAKEEKHAFVGTSNGTVVVFTDAVKVLLYPSFTKAYL